MIPSKLRYGTKTESAPARSYKTNVQPQNGNSYNNAVGAQIYFNIPTRSNLFMASTENYLRFDFTYKNTSGNSSSARWDSCGAHGLIQRIRVFHGSNLLEDIDNYGLLAKMLFDTQVHTDSTYGKMNILAGTRNDLCVNIPASTALTSAVDASVTQINSGESITVDANGNAIAIANNASTNKRTYCLNLISILGSLCSDKYFPLFACTSAPLRLEVWLVDNISKAMCTNGTGEINLNNVEFVANMIEVSDDVMGIVNNSLNGNPLQFVVPSYRNYGWSGNSIADGVTTQINMPIPAKFSSVKSLFVCMRDKQLGGTNLYPFSCVSLDFIDYYFRVGSLIMPPKYPYSTTEAFAELMKAVGSISDLNHTPSIELKSYTMKNSITSDNATRISTNSGSFYIGLDLENYVGANKDTIFAGYNTNTDDIYFVYDVTNSSGASVSPRFDSYALYDNLLVFQNGTVFAKF